MRKINVLMNTDVSRMNLTALGNAYRILSYGMSTILDWWTSIDCLEATESHRERVRDLYVQIERKREDIYVMRRTFSGP